MSSRRWRSTAVVLGVLAGAWPGGARTQNAVDGDAGAAEPASGEPDAPPAAGPVDDRLAYPLALELALFPAFTQRQIEGPNRDDLVFDEPHLAALLTVTWAVLDWLEPGLALHVDFGSSRSATFSRPDEAGEAVATAVVDGSYWELWVVLLARARIGWAFFELGWAPLMLRGDGARDDLPNEAGDADGTFVGSRAVAFLVAVGAAVPLTPRLALTLRLEGRVRYLVERGGLPLADEEEYGQMAVWPFVGLAYRF